MSGMYDEKVLISKSGEVSVGIGFLLWFTGIIVSKGFWAVTGAIFLPPYGFYLGLEHFLIHFGIVV